MKESGKLRTTGALTGGETHEVEVGVTDTKGPTGDDDNTIDDTITVTISVSGVDTEGNDPPEFVDGISVRYSIEEGVAGKFVGLPDTRDPDGDLLTYAIESDDSDGLFRIDTRTGRLTTAQPVDTRFP